MFSGYFASSKIRLWAFQAMPVLLLSNSSCPSIAIFIIISAPSMCFRPYPGFCMRSFRNTFRYLCTIRFCVYSLCMIRRAFAPYSLRSCSFPVSSSIAAAAYRIPLCRYSALTQNGITLHFFLNGSRIAEFSRFPLEDTRIRSAFF